MSVSIHFNETSALIAGATVTVKYCPEMSAIVKIWCFADLRKMQENDFDEDFVVINGDRDFGIRRWFDGAGVPYQVIP